MGRVTRETGISQAAISEMLGSSNCIDRSTEGEILRMVRRANCIPDTRTGSLHAGGAGIVKIVLPGVDARASDHLIGNVSSMLTERNCRVLLTGAGLRTRGRVRCVQLLGDEGISNVVLSTAGIRPRLVRRVHRLGVPFVVINRRTRRLAGIVFSRCRTTESVINLLVGGKCGGVTFVNISRTSHTINCLQGGKCLSTVGRRRIPIRRD